MTDAAKETPGRVLASADIVDRAGPGVRTCWQEVSEAQLRGIGRTIQLYSPATPVI